MVDRSGMRSGRMEPNSETRKGLIPSVEEAKVQKKEWIQEGLRSWHQPDLGTNFMDRVNRSKQ